MDAEIRVLFLVGVEQVPGEFDFFGYRINRVVGMVEAERGKLYEGFQFLSPFRMLD